MFRIRILKILKTVFGRFNNKRIIKCCTSIILLMKFCSLQLFKIDFYRWIYRVEGNFWKNWFTIWTADGTVVFATSISRENTGPPIMWKGSTCKFCNIIANIANLRLLVKAKEESILTPNIELKTKWPKHL